MPVSPSPRVFSARLIVKDQSGSYQPHPSNPFDPSDILKALTLPGQVEPFGQFYLQDPAPDEYRVQCNALHIRIAGMSGAQRVAYLEQHGTFGPTVRYFPAGQDATTWHGFVLAPRPYMDCPVGRSPAGPDMVRSGPVAQWLFLSRLLEADLLMLQHDTTLPNEMSGMLEGDSKAGDVVVAIGGGKSFVAAVVTDSTPRLTQAGAVAVLWAITFQRLNQMFLSAQGKAVLPHCGSFIARRTRPALCWQEEDLELLDRVRGELVANDAVWAPARPQRFWADDGSEVKWDGMTYQFTHAAARIIAELFRAASQRKEGVENRKLATVAGSDALQYRPSLAFRRKKGQPRLPGTNLLVNFQRDRTTLRPDVVAAVHRVL